MNTMSSRKLHHTIDMLLGLAERFAVLAERYPKIYLGYFKSIMVSVEKEERPMKKGMTQPDLILFLLRQGSNLTKIDLMIHHKIATPTARIAELRQRGHDILATWKTCPVDGSQYVEYSLNEKVAA